MEKHFFFYSAEESKSYRLWIKWFCLLSICQSCSSHSHSSSVDTPSRSACLLHDQAKSTATDYPDPPPPPHSFSHTDKLVWEPSVWFVLCLCLTVWNEVTLRHDADNRHGRWWGASPSGNCAKGIHTRTHNHLLSHTLIAWSLAFSL